MAVPPAKPQTLLRAGSRPEVQTAIDGEPTWFGPSSDQGILDWTLKWDPSWGSLCSPYVYIYTLYIYIS